MRRSTASSATTAAALISSTFSSSFTGKQHHNNNNNNSIFTSVSSSSSSPHLHSSCRFQSSSSTGLGGSGGEKGGFPFEADDEELERELKQQAAEFAATKRGSQMSPAQQQQQATEKMLARALGAGDGKDGKSSSATGGDQQQQQQPAIEIQIERVDRPPARFDINMRTGVYRWRTTAKYARRVTGPMREWADEFMCRTGVCAHMDPVDLEKATAGGYASADDVEVNLYLFGSERAVQDSVHFLKAMVQTEPCYVRCAVFRRAEPIDSSSSSSSSSSADGQPKLEWLTLRRVNPDSRPVDIPPISLKTPGKFTLLFESPEEAAVRTVFEETGLEIDRKTLSKTHVFDKAPPAFYWRPRVEYWVAEVPRDAQPLGPQVSTQRYVMHWDPRLLRQSADPIDRTWAAAADPKTGCAWLSDKVIDALQAPVKLETNYMATRYTPAPETRYASVVKF